MRPQSHKKEIQMPRITFDVYAIKLTEENIPRIVEQALTLGWTLDHLQDSMEDHALSGWTTTLFMKLVPDTNEIATFNDVPDTIPDDFRLTDIVDPIFGIFYKIEKL